MSDRESEGGYDDEGIEEGNVDAEPSAPALAAEPSEPLPPLARVGAGRGRQHPGGSQAGGARPPRAPAPPPRRRRVTSLPLTLSPLPPPAADSLSPYHPHNP